MGYCDDDANDVKLALKTLYGYQESNIVLLVDGAATRSAIVLAIEWARTNAGADDEVFFFFSGHGARGKASDGDSEKVDEAIVCHEAGEFSYIWDGELRSFFSGFSTTRIILVFDSCLSGGMTDLNAPGRVIAMASSENGVSLRTRFGAMDSSRSTSSIKECSRAGLMSMITTAIRNLMWS